MQQNVNCYGHAWGEERQREHRALAQRQRENHIAFRYFVANLRQEDDPRQAYDEHPEILIEEVKGGNLPSVISTIHGPRVEWDWDYEDNQYAFDGSYEQDDSRVDDWPDGIDIY